MDPIVGPLCSALALTASALWGLDGDKLTDGLRGLAGNLAAGTIDASTRGILARLGDATPDPATGLPRNHDLQRTSLDALRSATLVLLARAAGEFDPRKPWLLAITEFARSGRLGKEPLLAAFQRPELQELSALESAVQTEDFAHWHDAIRLSDRELAECFQGQRCSLSAALPLRFQAWAQERIASPALRETLNRLLLDGWTTQEGLSPHLRFEDIYCLFLREFLKVRPEVFRILMADELFAQAQTTRATVSDMERLDRMLGDFVGVAAKLLEDQQALLASIRDGQRELASNQSELATAIVLLRGEALQGVTEAADELKILHDHINRLAQVFTRVERKLFGLPLIRPSVSKPPPPSDDNVLWIIQARYRSLELVGRDADLESLRQWLHSESPISIRLLTGTAGAGKTRLGFELIWDVAAKLADWDAGRIESAQLYRLVDHSHPVDWRWDKPTLVLIDYARAGGEALEMLLRELARRADDERQPKLRLLLLERSQSASEDWLDRLKQIEHSDGGQPAGTLFDPPGPVPLTPMTGIEQRRKLFTQTLARTKSGAALVVPPRGANSHFDAMLAREDWAEPLVPMMAALVAARSGHLMSAMNMSRTDLADRLAHTETERLTRFAKRHGLKKEDDLRLFCHVAAMHVLCGGLSIGEARAIAEGDGQTLGLRPDCGPAVLVDALSEAWAGPGDTLAALQPDLVAEAFVLRHMADKKRRHDARDALLRHAAGHERPMAGLILRAFQNFQNSAEESEALGLWCLALVDQGLAQRDPALLAALDDAMPTQTVYLRQAAAHVARTRLHALHAVPRDSLSPQDIHELGRLLNNLAIRLSEVGDRAGALAPAWEAAEICRVLAAQNPDAFRPNLASALNNLAAFLSEVGDRAGALAPAQEALEIYRALAAQNPDAFRPDLAMSLNNLANHLSEVGDRAGALAPAREAVELLAPAFLRHPQAYAQWMRVFGKTYLEQCEACGQEPDEELLLPIIAQLQEMAGNP